jgi:uncharacterized protein with HEPN domain
MRPEDAVAGLLWDMREFGREAMSLAEGLDYAGFLANRPVRLAVERLLELVGEAARRVSPDFKAAHLEIPWSGIIGRGNVLAHDYGVIDPGELWESLSEDLPILIPPLDALIPPLPDDDA